MNFATAAAVAVLSILQDQSVGTIILRVAGALIALQVLYVLWLVAVAWLRPRDAKTENGDNSEARKEPVGTPAEDA